MELQILRIRAGVGSRWASMTKSRLTEVKQKKTGCSQHSEINEWMWETARTWNMRTGQPKTLNLTLEGRWRMTMGKSTRPANNSLTWHARPQFDICLPAVLVITGCMPKPITSICHQPELYQNHQYLVPSSQWVWTNNIEQKINLILIVAAFRDDFDTDFTEYWTSYSRSIITPFQPRIRTGDHNNSGPRPGNFQDSSVLSLKLLYMLKPARVSGFISNLKIIPTADTSFSSFSESSHNTIIRKLINIVWSSQEDGFKRRWELHHEYVGYMRESREILRNGRNPLLQ